MQSSQEERHGRRSSRLPGYDYSQAGAYFVTMSAHGWATLFGTFSGEGFTLSRCGEIVEHTWQQIPLRYAGVQSDLYVVMPNHMHGILLIADNVVGAGFQPARAKTPSSLPSLVRAFKTYSAREINLLRGTQGTAVWQRGYYEHVIRNEMDLSRIREYIATNRLKWALDRENPERVGLSSLEKELFD